MNNKNNGIVSAVLKALLDGRIINRRNFDNGSLHSWVSTLRNQRFIPVESGTKNQDGTCDYYMLPHEIVRFKNPEFRKIQQDEMKLVIELERQQKIIADIFVLLERLVAFPMLWSLWDELPHRLEDIAMAINSLLNNEKNANQ